MRRHRIVAVSPRPLIVCDLIGGQERPRFKMRGQMNRAQVSLQFTDQPCLGHDAISAGITLCKQLIKRPFMDNHFVAEWFGRGAHAIENKLDLPRLILGQ